MTRLVLDIPNVRDLELLLPWLRRLMIRYAGAETPAINPAKHAAVLHVIEQGCEIGSYGELVND